MNALIILIVLLAIFCLGLLSLVYIEWLKRDQRKTRAVFIYKDNTAKIKKIRKIKDVIEFDEATYTYDKKNVVKKGNKDFIYYQVNNPYPLSFETTGKLSFTAKNINTLIEENILEKLLGGANADLKKLKIMQIVVIVGIVIILGYFFFGGEKVVSIASEENKVFIENAIKSALK